MDGYRQKVTCKRNSIVMFSCSCAGYRMRTSRHIPSNNNKITNKSNNNDSSRRKNIITTRLRANRRAAGLASWRKSQAFYLRYRYFIPVRCAVRMLSRVPPEDALYRTTHRTSVPSSTAITCRLECDVRVWVVIPVQLPESQ